LLLGQQQGMMFLKLTFQSLSNGTEGTIEIQTLERGTKLAMKEWILTTMAMKFVIRIIIVFFLFNDTTAYYWRRLWKVYRIDAYQLIPHIIQFDFQHVPMISCPLKQGKVWKNDCLVLLLWFRNSGVVVVVSILIVIIFGCCGRLDGLDQFKTCQHGLVAIFLLCFLVSCRRGHNDTSQATS
jgi:hypothetical protein